MPSDLQQLPICSCHASCCVPYDRGAGSALASGTLHSSVPVNIDAFSTMAAPVASKNVAAADKAARATNTQPKRVLTWLEL